MAVNQPSSPAALGGTREKRLYLKEDQLDGAVDLVFKASRRFWRQAEDKLAERHLGPAHYRALAAARREGPISVKELQHVLGVRKQSLARTLRELERAGLIRREVDMRDRRMRRVCVTDLGLSAEQAATAALRERLGEIFRIAGEDAVEGALQVLQLLALTIAPSEEEDLKR